MARWATASDARLGRVVRVDRGLVSVLTETGPHRVSLGGRVLARLAEDPTRWAVHLGDLCVLRDWPDHRCTLEELLPRRTVLRRAVAGEQSRGQLLCVNMDLAAVVVGVQPLPALSRVERLVALAWESGAQPLVVLTKADLVTDAADVAEDVAAAAPGVEVLVVSSVSGRGGRGPARAAGGVPHPGARRRLRARQVVADQRARRGRGARHPGAAPRRPRPAHLGPARARPAARRRGRDRHPGAARGRSGRHRHRCRPHLRRRRGSSRRTAASTTAPTPASRAAPWLGPWRTGACRTGDSRAGCTCSGSLRWIASRQDARLRVPSGPSSAGAGSGTPAGGDPDEPSVEP